LRATLVFAGGLIATAIGLRLILVGWELVPARANTLGRLGRLRAFGVFLTCIGAVFIDTGIAAAIHPSGLQRRLMLWLALIPVLGAVAAMVWPFVELSRERAQRAGGR
jgi:hypothetical protein